MRTLEHVDSKFGPGEIIVLLGMPGSGEPTLPNLMNGLDTLTSGSAVYRNHGSSHAGDRGLTRFRRERVGFIFQFYNLTLGLTARENVALVTDIARHPLDPTEALNRIGIGTLADNFPSQMSGDEQRRVATARAVAERPDVLLYNEPTSALDSRTRQPVLEVPEQVNRELGTPTVIVTCNAVIADMVDRAVRMSSDTIVEHRRDGQRAWVEDLAW